jgi:HEAT repeat protein
MPRGSPNKTSARSLVERLNGRSSIDVYEAAKKIWERDDPRTLRSVIRTLKRGKRALNRAAAAYALHLMHGRTAIAALESTVQNRQEHPKVRGQAAESLAITHRASSHRVLLRNLQDPSKDVRFWCAYALAEMGDTDALAGLRKLAKEDQRIVKGFWSVSREANWAIRRIQEEARRKGRRKRCSFCTTNSLLKNPLLLQL